MTLAKDFKRDINVSIPATQESLTIADAGRLSVIIGDMPFKMEFEGFFEINQSRTLQHVEEAEQFHPDTHRLFEFVISAREDAPNPVDYVYGPDSFCPQTFRGEREGRGYQHLAGLLDLSLICIDHGVSFGWMEPENSLHPSLMRNLVAALRHLIEMIELNEDATVEKDIEL